MARRIKVSRKELLKEPDQFLTTSERVAVFFDEHRSPLLISVAVILVLLASFWGFRYNQQVKSLRLEQLYFEIDKVRGDKLEKNPQEAIAEMEKLYDQFPDSPQKTRASLLLAGGYFRNGQLDKAIALYQDIADKNHDDKISRQLARAGLAASYEEKKEYSKAVESYKSIIEKSGSFPLFHIYLGLARCYDLNKDPNNALLTLCEAKNKFQGHPQLESVERQIRKLSGQA